ncbi:MAG: lipoprotein signal peptidase [Paludibacteraceae bacterium]|nr:lipoprotein signal peptidase [Paludibacteraceae bacterium]
MSSLRQGSNRFYLQIVHSEQKKTWICASALILAILLVDQIVKFYVKTHFYLHESVEVTSWFFIRFEENNGIAFGLEFFKGNNKMILTILRIIAVGALGYYLHYVIKKKHRLGFVLSIAAIIAGAAGNIIDCVFYGYCFNSSAGQVAQFMPEGGGYAPLFCGKVVDMLKFPLFSATWPEWLPLIGGDSFTFFSPIFNLADSAITVSVFVILIFYRQYLSENSKDKE